MNKEDIARIKATAQRNAQEKLSPPKPKRPQLKFQCGHVKDIMNCPDCKAEARQKKSKRYQDGRQQKQEASRLPDGANYNVCYSAVEKRWSGVLTIESPGEPITFRDSASGVFRLLQSLDRMYREYLQEKSRKE